MSKSMSPASTTFTSVLSRPASAAVNAGCSPASGNPSALQSRRACSTLTPAAEATSSLVSAGASPRMARSSRSRV